jgi:hypothetical protein
MLQRVTYKMSFTYPCPRKLREVMKMSMIERESTTRIEEIWKEYHNPRINNTCAVLPKEHYQHLFSRYLCPYSVLALPPCFFSQFFAKAATSN